MQLATDYKLKMVDLFKAGKITEARKLICSQVLPEEMDEIYRWFMTTLNCSETKSNKTVLC